MRARGQHLHLHPNVIASGIFPKPIHAYYGIPQSYYIDEFIDLERDPHRGYVLMPIAGSVADQAALHGLLKKVRDLGMPLLSVTCVKTDQTDALDVNK